MSACCSPGAASPWLSRAAASRSPGCTRSDGFAARYAPSPLRSSSPCCSTRRSGSARAARRSSALDASESWTRDGDSALRASARPRGERADAGQRAAVRRLAAQRAPRTSAPADRATRAAAAERAVGAGRPLDLITDGELDDPAALPGFRPGRASWCCRTRQCATSHRRVRRAARRRERRHGGGPRDRARRRSRRRPAGCGSCVARRARRLCRSTRSPERAERSVTVRAPMPAREGSALLRAMVSVSGDDEPRNDTLAVAVEVSRAAGRGARPRRPTSTRGTCCRCCAARRAAHARVLPRRTRPVATGRIARAGGRRTVREAARRAPIARDLHGDTRPSGRRGRRCRAQSLVPGAPSGAAPGPSGTPWTAPRLADAPARSRDVVGQPAADLGVARGAARRVGRGSPWPAPAVRASRGGRRLGDAAPPAWSSRSARALAMALSRRRRRRTRSPRCGGVYSTG